VRGAASCFDPAVHQLLDVVDLRGGLEQDDDVGTVGHVNEHEGSEQDQRQDASRQALGLGCCSCKLNVILGFFPKDNNLAGRPPPEQSESRRSRCTCFV
jgi:hypothetical protein